MIVVVPGLINVALTFDPVAVNGLPRNVGYCNYQGLETLCARRTASDNSTCF